MRTLLDSLVCGGVLGLLPHLNGFTQGSTAPLGGKTEGRWPSRAE